MPLLRYIVKIYKWSSLELCLLHLMSKIWMLNSFFFKIQTSCKIPILFELCLGPKSGRGRSPWVQNGVKWFADQVVQLVLEYLTTLAMQRKQQQQQCIIYSMRRRASLHQNSGQISVCRFWPQIRISRRMLPQIHFQSAKSELRSA